MTAARERAGAEITIDLSAIRRNYRALAGRVGVNVRVAAVVKADAYGLGAVPVATALWKAGCRDYFVATLDEAIDLRATLSQASIYVLDGPQPRSAPDFVANRLIPVVNSLDQWDWFIHEARGSPARVAVHVDTGMNRLGLPTTECEQVARAASRLQAVDVVLLQSHLACADEPNHVANRQQLETFHAVRSAFAAAFGTAPPASLANGSGVFLGPEYHFDLVRPGAALYGINPLPGHPNQLDQAVALKAKILQVRHVDRGMSVGYGAAHLVARAGRIGTIPVGYADGVLRASESKAYAIIGEQRVPFVGRVSMDLITLDLTDVPDHFAVPGTDVALIGPERPIDNVAADAGTIGYEVLTRLSRRIPRRYVDQDR